MNIPGGGGSAATMVDGFPMAKKGEAARAMSASIFSAAAQGTFWGILTILFLPYYATMVLSFKTPEMWCFLMLAMTCICFVNSQYWLRGIVGLIIGIAVGHIGIDPVTNAQRWTGGWFYLADGLQFAPVMAGLIALPEIITSLWIKTTYMKSNKDNWQQIKQGALDFWQNKWLSFRSGLIGGLVGMMPGIGGAIVDWLAYGQTVATNNKEKILFGQGNVKGVIGPEGANLAQKATAYVPTVLFGIPAAPFELVIMFLLGIVGIELGSPRVLKDQNFFNALTFGFMASMVLTVFISLWFIRYATLITRVPFVYWGIPVIILIAWSCAQYTGGWEDYAILFIFTIVGLFFKYFKINRIAFLIGFVLSNRLELVNMHFFQLYKWTDLLYRPVCIILLAITLLVLIYGICYNKTKIDYA